MFEEVKEVAEEVGEMIGLMPAEICAVDDATKEGDAAKLADAVLGDAEFEREPGVVLGEVARAWDGDTVPGDAGDAAEAAVVPEGEAGDVPIAGDEPATKLAAAAEAAIAAAASADDPARCTHDCTCKYVDRANIDCKV